jgi:hypothetical protein
VGEQVVQRRGAEVRGVGWVEVDQDVSDGGVEGEPAGVDLLEREDGGHLLGVAANHEEGVFGDRLVLRRRRAAKSTDVVALAVEPHRDLGPGGEVAGKLGGDGGSEVREAGVKCLAFALSFAFPLSFALSLSFAFAFALSLTGRGGGGVTVVFPVGIAADDQTENQAGQENSRPHPTPPGGTVSAGLFIVHAQRATPQHRLATIALRLTPRAGECSVVVRPEVVRPEVVRPEVGPRVLVALPPLGA